MVINNDEQLGLIVVLNCVVTPRMISQQYQVPYMYTESFATSPTLAFLALCLMCFNAHLFALIRNSCCSFNHTHLLVES